jgi:Flp pilus assembly protein TadG
MRYLVRPLRSKRQDGSVAVEAALVISLVLVPLIAFVLLFGRYFWYYTMAQKAAHDATLVMSTSPLGDIRSYAASTLANGVITSETDDIDQSTALTRVTTTECWYRIPANALFLQPFNCGITTATPVLVRTTVAMAVTDPLLGRLSESVLGGAALQITAQSSVRYVGR